MAEAALSHQAYQVGEEETSTTQRELRARLSAIVGRLEREAEERVSKRTNIEKRWIEDLQQYHGKYDDKTLSELTQAKKSKLFINHTRRKTNTMEARLSDMLFPTDDRNWGIKPTPVPEMTVEAEQAALSASEQKQAAAANPEDAQMAQRANEAENIHRQIQLIMEEARKRSMAMQEEIDDHMRQCRYAIQARDVIHDACKLGTGIMKGPVTGGRGRRSWKQREDGAYALQSVKDQQPRYWRVDPWNFFPDMDARSMEDCDGVFERHLMNPKELRSIAREPGFDEEAIRRLLRDEPRSGLPTYIADLRSITSSFHDTSMERYHVYEYHGQLTAEDLRDVAVAIGQPELIEDIGLGEEVDPLQELNVLMWFCQGELLKFGIHHLDSGDSVYSVFCLEKDDACLFGFGVPYLMRDSQSSLNAAWRTMLDNAGLSSGPQIVVDEDVIEPANGVWGMEPRKIWKKKSTAPANRPGFETYDIPMHQAELAGIIELSKQNIDDETSIPVIAEGEQGSHVTQTAQGMSILMNSVNVVFRRIVKNWDDDMTTPNIRRIYDFLMQFSPKQYIKGDYEVDARGTSVLLVREMQSANMLQFLMNFSGHPILGKYLKDEGLPALRKLSQAMMVPADEMLKSDEEVAEDQARAAEQDPQVDPEIMKVEAEMNMKRDEIQGRKEIAMLERETKMMELAAKHNITLEDLRTKLQIKGMETNSKERLFASEAAIEQRMAASGEGAGSGGYISAGGNA